ncbi:M56 family metallopeptidase [Mycobacterium antarcticum]|uniref:M56 family metallopeptidase n=1 Tax=unclassified Mycolicibacterium TaxID=2636767 RepID=UPI0024E15D95|nr:MULTISPECIES: M56 family metallopeptidase [unclassified Mycolicibacterium]
MNATMCLLGYGALLSWCAPRLLARITGNGLSPRFSIAVWLCAIAMALGAWTVVGVGVVRDVVAVGPHGPVEYCSRIVDDLVHLGLPGRVALAGLGLAALAASAIVIRRIIMAFRQFWATSRDHAHDARLAGSPRASSDVVVLRADQPAAYCVAGRPDAIVLTTGAIDALGEAELAAVLAHERAHLSGRHLQLMMLLRSLSDAMPRLPLFRRAVDSVGRLVEMCADDTAARQHGRVAVLNGLVALAGQPRPIRGALGAADTAAVARAIRLSGPVRRGARLRQRVLLAATMAALIGIPAAVSALCSL